MFQFQKMVLIKNINGVDFSEVVEINNPYELQDLYLKCHDLYEARTVEVEEPELEPKQSVEENQDIDFDSTDDSEIEDSIENTELNDEDTIEEHEDSEGSEKNGLEVSTEENSEVEPNTDPEEDKILESNNFSVKKVVGEDKDLGLQFIVDNRIYFINAEATAEHEVPLDRFTEVVGTTEKHGVVMTADEIAMHTFSKNVSSDVKKCEELIFRIFE